MKNSKKDQKVKCYEFYVDGMHCAACELLIEKKLSKLEGIEKVDADLDHNKVTVYTNLDESTEELADDLTELVEPDGYKIFSEKEIKTKSNLIEFLYATPIAIIFILLFLILQLTGVLNLFEVKNGLTLSSAFILGLIASVSSCMAVVGGLSLSISASYAKISNSAKYKPQIYFHVGRLIGFFAFGAGIGIIGDQFRNYLESSSIPDLLILFSGLVMLILGINLLDIFHFTKRLQIKLPKFISRKVLRSDEIKNELTPLLLGAFTFFLPCGFTIATQVEALKISSLTGNIFDAAILMLIFALGTLPALAFVSFGAVNLSHSKFFRSGIFYKTSGLIIIAFALVSIYGFVSKTGFANPILNF